MVLVDHLLMLIPHHRPCSINSQKRPIRVNPLVAAAALRTCWALLSAPLPSFRSFLPSAAGYYGMSISYCSTLLFHNLGFMPRSAKSLSRQALAGSRTVCTVKPLTTGPGRLPLTENRRPPTLIWVCHYVGVTYALHRGGSGLKSIKDTQGVKYYSMLHNIYLADTFVQRDNKCVQQWR